MDISTSIGNSISKGSVNEEFSISQAALEDARNQKPESISNEEIRQGDMILETYTVTSNAIHGGMGSVWQVHHQNWNTDLAMKRPQPRFFSEGSEKRKEEFIAECENWINLGLHPNIVSCYYVREIGGVPTIFSEWMENGSLKDRIRDGALYEGTAQEVQKRILDIAIRSAYGLAYSHENGLIHQDVKPGNLLLTKDWEAKVADFGLAKAQSRLTDGAKPASTGYTIAYCPKEQAEGAPAEKWMDVYAWALTVLEMYAGKRLWKTGDEVHWKRSEIYSQCRIAFTPRMEELIDCCLAKEIDDFLRVEEYLNEEYLDLHGKAYPQSASKAAPDTAESLNNRALSFLDLGKESEAEKIWSQKKNSLHAESVFNYTLYQIQEGKTGFHEGILTLRNLFLKNPSSNTAAAYARILSLNGQTTFDKETETLLTPEQRIAGDEIFASYEEKQKADLSEQVIVLPAPFEDSSQFHKVQAVYVDPHHRSALVADDWLWSNLTVHRRFFLVGIDESSPVREVPLKNSGLIRNLQMDAECRYALCCSVNENKAYTEICRLEEEKEVQKFGQYDFCFFRDSTLMALRIEAEHQIVLYELPKVQSKWRTTDHPSWKAHVPINMLERAATILCSRTGRMILISDEENLLLLDAETGERLSEYRRTVYKEYSNLNYYLNCAVIDEDGEYLLTQDEQWNLYCAERKCNMMTGLFSDVGKPDGVSLWEAGPSPVVLVWKETGKTTQFSFRRVSAPKAWEYCLNRVVSSEKSVSEHEKCRRQMEHIQLLLQRGDTKAAVEAWEKAYELTDWMQTEGFRETENALDGICSRNAVRCVEAVYTMNETGKVFTISRHGFVVCSDEAVYYCRLSDGKVLMKLPFRDFATEVRRPMMATLSPDDKTVYLLMEGDSPGLPIYVKIFALDIRTQSCITCCAFKDLNEGDFLLTHPYHNIVYFCGRKINDTRKQIRVIDGEKNFRVRKGNTEEPGLKETLSIGMASGAGFGYYSYLNLSNQNLQWIQSQSDLNSQAKIEITKDRRFAAVHSFRDAALLYIPEHRRELELKEVTGERYLSPDGRCLLVSSVMEHRISRYNIHYHYMYEETIVTTETEKIKTERIEEASLTKKSGFFRRWFGGK